MIFSVSSSVLYRVNWLAYALVRSAASRALPHETEMSRRSASDAGATLEAASTSAPVAPGTPAAAATLTASSGERATLAWVARNLVGSPIAGSEIPVIADTMLERLTRIVAVAR